MASHRLKTLFSIKECMTCGSLYTANFFCSKEGLADKILVPEPDSSPCCVKCRTPVDGAYYRGCALLRKEFEEDLLKYCVENGIFQDSQDTFESSDDNTNVINALQEPIVVNQDPGKKSSQEQCNQTINELPQILPSVHYEDENSFTYDSKPNSFNNSPSVHPTCNYEDENSFTYDSKPNSFNNSPSVLTYPPQLQFETYLCELCGNNAHYGYDCSPQFPFGSEVRKKEQAYNEEQYSAVRRRMLSIPFIDEDDYIPLGDIIARYSTSKAITPALSSEAIDSLIMEDEHLDTIPEMESNEFIKSSVENLVQNPSKSADLSDGESECDVPINDDSPESHFTTFSNPLFDSNDDFSSDDESLSEEEIQKDEFKYFSNPLYDLDDEIITNEKIIPNQKDLDVVIPIPPRIDKHCLNAKSDLLESLLNHDSPIDSTKIDSIFDEFSLPRPPEESNSEISDATIESLSPSPILIEDSDSLMEEIDLFLASDDSMPTGIEIVDYDSEGDIRFLEELLSNDSPPLPENESFSLDHFDDPSLPRPPPEPPDVEICFNFEPDAGVVTKKVVGDISEHDVLMPNLLPTQPTLCPVFDLLLPFSSKNEDKVFKPGISDRDVVAGVDAGIDMEVDVRFDVEDEVEDKVEFSDRGTMEVGVDVVVGIDIPDGMLMLDAVERLEQVEEVVQDIYGHVIEIPLQRIEDIETGQRELEARSLIAGGERASLLDQVVSLERSNEIGDIHCEAFRFSSMMLCMDFRLIVEPVNMTVTSSGMTLEAIEELIIWRVKEALTAYEVTRTANALEAESQSQNGNENDNRNGGDGNGGDGSGGNGNPNENNRGARPVSRRVFIALTWWNSHERTVGTDVAFAMSWRELMKLMAEVYYPRNEIQKMESELWNLTVKNNDLAAYT
ncbi:ribonuclease H-like domain-containing protein [Tanacetum coccineum]